MTNEEKAFLQAQLEWCQTQERLLEQIDEKLQEMKQVAEAALDEHLLEWEREALNGQFHDLRQEVIILEKSRHEAFH